MRNVVRNVDYVVNRVLFILGVKIEYFRVVFYRIGFILNF